MRRSFLAVFLAAAAAITVAVGMIHPPFGTITDVAHESAQLHLHLTASSLYEYRERTGKWPTKNADLALTSLPSVSPYWKTILDEGVIVIVWDKTWKAKPADNADRILAYYAKGQISERGQSWVCWGDLRTEYIKTEDLHAYLDKMKN